MSPENESELETAAAHWDRRFGDQAGVEQREAYYALAHPLYQKLYFNPHFSSDGTDWVEWVKRTLAHERPFERALVLGCGLGDGLLDLHRRGIARRLHGIDLSAAAIEQSQVLAARAGLSDRVTFEVGDFHACPLEAGAFDVVFTIGSLHHALDLERVLGRIRDALRPDGVFVANEYVGPSRWQYTTLQLLLVKALLTLLPRRLRRKPDGSVKGRIGRPTLAWMLATDPSEAAHSAEIPARFGAAFELTHRVDFGGAIALPVLDEIIANFREDERGGMGWLRAVLALDRFTWRTGLVKSANAVLVGRKRAAARPGRAQ
jgi:SAM-dependent methyltransferase